MVSCAPEVPSQARMTSGCHSASPETLHSEVVTTPLTETSAQEGTPLLLEPTVQEEPWPAVEWPEPTWLTEIVDTLSLNIAESAIWLFNPVAAQEAAGLEHAESAEEWFSWTAEQQEAYWNAREGIPGSGIHYTMWESYPDWDETFGFSAWDVIAMSETGERQRVGFEVNALTGRFDKMKIQENLLALGYQGCSHAGMDYLALPEDRRLDLNWLADAVAYSNVMNVFTDGRILLTAPTEEELVELLSARAGETPSLGHDPAFGDLVFSMPDPLFIAIFNRHAVPAPANLPAARRERPAEWGSMQNWEALSASFSRSSPDLKRITIALWYAEKADAEGSEQELYQRFEPVDGLYPEWMLGLGDSCGSHWGTQVSDTPAGAVLSVSCQVDAGSSSEGLAAMMHGLLVEGTVAFLVN